MADENPQDIQEAYQIKVEKAIALARTTNVDQLGALNKMVETQTNGLWSVEDEGFRKVFDEWYKGFLENPGEPKLLDFIMEERVATHVSRPIDQETLNEWDKIAQNAARIKTRVAQRNKERRVRFEIQLQEAKTQEDRAKAKKLLEQNELATKTSLREAYLHDSVRPDTLKAVLDHETDRNPEKNLDINRSIRKARVLDVLQQNVSGENNAPETAGGSSLFRALAEERPGLLTKPIASYLDTQLDGLTDEDKENVKQHLFKRAFENIVKNSQQLTDRAGAEAAKTITDNLRTRLASSGELPSISGAAKTVTDVGGLVFGPTLQNGVAEVLVLENSADAVLRPLAGLAQLPPVGAAGTETQVLVNGVFVSGRINTSVLETAIVHSRLPLEFSLFTSQGGRLVLSTAGTAGTGAVVGVAGKRAAGGLLGKLLAGFGIKAGTTAASVVVGTVVTPGVGTVIGIVGSFIGPIWNGFKKGASAFFSGKLIPFVGDGISAVSSYLGNGLPAPKKDSVGLIIVVLLSMAILLPMGTTLYQTTSYRGSALISSVGGGEYIPGMAVDCDKTPEDPRCSMTACNPAIQECRWPTNGTITQGPFTSCGNTSHRSANAIDIGAPVGTDVYATTTGVVTSVYRGCVDNTGSVGSTCGGGYGNFVTIRTNAGYSLRFGHLSQGSIKVNVGDVITNPNMAIADVDQNGSSSGPHLHFELIGSVSINSILPLAVGHCSNNTAGCPGCNMTTQ